MNRIMLALLCLFSVNLSNAELAKEPKITPVLRLLLINDVYTWMGGGKSYYKWDEYLRKEYTVNREILSPVQIYYEFKRNIFNAEDLFTNNMQVVRAPFQSIQKNTNGEPVVVLDVDYGHHIYLHGLTPREVRDLKVNVPVQLLCTRFKLDKMNDMSATCSMIMDKNKFASSHLVRHLKDSDIKKLFTPLDIKVFNQMEKMIDKDALELINNNCKTVDSTNIDLCLGQAEYGISNLGK